MGRLGILWKNNRILVIAFAVSIAVMLFFAVRFALFVVYWNDPAHRNQPIEPWMTIGYVAHSWQVPRDELIERLNIPPAHGKPPPLDKLAEEMGVPYEQLVENVNDTVQALVAERPKR